MAGSLKTTCNVDEDLDACVTRAGEGEYVLLGKVERATVDEGVAQLINDHSTIRAPSHLTPSKKPISRHAWYEYLKGLKYWTQETKSSIFSAKNPPLSIIANDTSVPTTMAFCISITVAPISSPMLSPAKTLMS